MKLKTISIAQKIYGLGLMGFGVCFLLISFLPIESFLNEFYKQVKKQIDLEGQINALNATMDVWSLYMPFLILIGIMYTASGFLINNKKGIVIGLLAIISNTIWIFLYGNKLIVEVAPVMPKTFPPFFLYVGVFFFGAILLIYPIYFLFNIGRIVKNV